MRIRALLLPGLGGSGPDHWQSIWAGDDSACRIVRQEDWNQPKLLGWLQGLAAACGREKEPYGLVAHSLGCALAAHWPRFAEANSIQLPLFIMMVAPADVDSEARTPRETREFSPMPLGKLPSASVVIASSDDPYVSLSRAHFFSGCWGSEFHEIGPLGHINGESGLGAWQTGKLLLRACRHAAH